MELERWVSAAVGRICSVPSRLPSGCGTSSSWQWTLKALNRYGTCLDLFLERLVFEEAEQQHLLRSARPCAECLMCVIPFSPQAYDVHSVAIPAALQMRNPGHRRAK